MTDEIFPSNNQYDIPWLRIQQCPITVRIPAHNWRDISQRSRSVRTWMFYTDDYKFDAIWRSPDKIVRSNAVAACECNYSLNDSTPKAVAIWQTFKKRWLARYWQEHNIGIFVDLNVPRKHDALNMLGVPMGWHAYSTRAADYEIDRLEEQVKLARQRAQSNDLLMLVYSGGKLVRDLCEREELIYIPDPKNEARKSG